jgi:hypothetical protein
MLEKERLGLIFPQYSPMIGGNQTSPALFHTVSMLEGGRACEFRQVMLAFERASVENTSEAEVKRGQKVGWSK